MHGAFSRPGFKVLIVSASDVSAKRMFADVLGMVTGALEQYWASPVAGDGKVYVISGAGKVVVLKAAGEWEIVGMNDMEEDVFATPALVNGRIYLRTRNHLYCFASL